MCVLVLLQRYTIGMLSTFPNGDRFNFPLLNSAFNSSLADDFVQPNAFVTSTQEKAQLQEYLLLCLCKHWHRSGSSRSLQVFSEGEHRNWCGAPDTTIVRSCTSNFSNKSFKTYGMSLVLCIRQLTSNQSKYFGLMGFLFFPPFFLFFLNTKTIKISHNILFLSL